MPNPLFTYINTFKGIKDRMFKRILTVCLFFGTSYADAQQFIGLTTNNYPAIMQLPSNPALVNNALTGAEINLISVNALAGNNAYQVSGAWLMKGDFEKEAREGYEYARMSNNQRKRAWANVDIMGPAVSFTVNKQYQVGIYTRARAIVNAGNISTEQLKVYTDENNPEYYNHTLSFKKVGASAHAFGEVGITLGKMLREDEYYKLSAGVTLKYLIGYAAVNAFAGDLTYQRVGDTASYAKGDITALYTYNTVPGQTSDLAQRAGRGGIGLDIGIQYSYHPYVELDKKDIYRYKLGIAITDIGSVGYVGDKGSAAYALNAGKTNLSDLEFIDADQQEYTYYLKRQTESGRLKQNETGEKFRIGLPTALRANFDYNAGGGLFLSVNTLLNLKGSNGSVFRPGYVGYLNLTPRIDLKFFKFGLPITLMRYTNLNMGAIVYMGPLFVGTNTLISAIAGQNISNVDVYTGLALKLTKREKVVRQRTFDNGYDDPTNGIKRFIPRFLRGGNEERRSRRNLICPPGGMRNNSYKSYYSR